MSPHSASSMLHVVSGVHIFNPTAQQWIGWNRVISLRIVLTEPGHHFDCRLLLIKELVLPNFPASWRSRRSYCWICLSQNRKRALRSIFWLFLSRECEMWFRSLTAPWRWWWRWWWLWWWWWWWGRYWWWWWRWSTLRCPPTRLINPQNWAIQKKITNYFQ